MQTILTIIGIIAAGLIADIATLPLIAKNAKKDPGSMMTWSIIQMSSKNLLVILLTIIAFSL